MCFIFRFGNFTTYNDNNLSFRLVLSEVLDKFGKRATDCSFMKFRNLARDRCRTLRATDFDKLSEGL